MPPSIGQIFEAPSYTRSDPTITGGFGDIPVDFSPYNASNLFEGLFLLGRGDWTESENSKIRSIVVENGGTYMDEKARESCCCL